MPAELKKISPLCCTTIQGASVSNLIGGCSNCQTNQPENVVIPESLEGSPILNKRKLSKNFIVISDLTHRMKLPRILDLKLGTRQHGDHATMAKVACMTAKCQATTSATLGVRLCGMKYQEEEENRLVKVGKYEGRSMNEQELFKSLEFFFDLPNEIVGEIRRKMGIIRNVLMTANGVRLFGASLLIVIEGDQEVLKSQPISNSVRIKIVDFANATFNGFLVDNKYDGVDDGSIMGLDTIDQFLARKSS